MKVLVTGATGFIGRHLVESLKRNNAKIRCLVRKTSNIEHLQNLGLEFIFGNLLDKKSLKEAVKDVKVIYHLAGKVFARRTRDFYDVNVTGTKNLLEAILSNKVDRFIYFSSIAAVGPNKNGNTLLCESSPYRPITTYGKSKSEAEKLVREFSNKYGLSTIIIRPPMVYGPGAIQCRSSKLFQMIRKRKFLFVGDGKNKINTCYIENLINGVLLLDEKGGNLINTIHFFGDAEVLTFNELVKIIAEEEGVKVTNVHTPILFAKLIALISQGLSKVFNLTPLITLDTVREIVNTWNYDMTFTRKELGYMPKVKLKEGVRKTVLWNQLKKNTYDGY